MSTGELKLQDTLDPARANALNATLGLTGTFGPGDPLPPFFHQVFFWDAQPPETLGRDGHPRVGNGLIPDLGLPRRMWAGGDLEFLEPLKVGHLAEKTSRVLNVVEKTGRSGRLGFVTLEHVFTQGGEICVREKQDLVYRQAPRPDEKKPTPPKAPADETFHRAWSFSPTLLFRYSALTFNGHRIHYDVDYARTIEGYDGLVVHGPLFAQGLILLAQGQLGDQRMTRFTFRATAPLVHSETTVLCGRGSDLWVRGPGGRLCMQATYEAAGLG